ncbi:ATP-dependent helicase SGS1 [Nakaseomyces bracarensis]|uniref:ATP-dependent DNA helicase n=1 Tax=Nakaseomyces bracarensis TaxID=273131 RepID=A0ABR4NRJ5_9SACH
MDDNIFLYHFEGSGYGSDLFCEDIDLDNVYEEDIKSAMDVHELRSEKEAVLASSRSEISIEEVYPWTKEVNNILHEKFLLQSFRNSQLDIINAALQGKDVFVLMATGGGKSLCYQLPSLVDSGVTRGTTIVISPLISLMQNQVESLLNKRIKACMLCSNSSAKQKRITLELLRECQLDLFYISPEMIVGSSQCKALLRGLYRNNFLSRIVIDEAHCISSWGHDFRPEYKQLSFLRQEFRGVPIMALTATATEVIINDIIKNLNLLKPLIFRDSFNRKNLFYEVKNKNNKTTDLIIYLIKSEFNNLSGIIYCSSKASCEKLSKTLNESGISSGYYHAGMKNIDRTMIQRKWQNNEVLVICATIAFGMGIDKLDVRFVFHFDTPRSLENYYQETGRAGRDGELSKCILFFCFQDVRKLQILIQREKVSRAQKEQNLQKLQFVTEYSINRVDCRRKQLLEYFNEEFFPEKCNKSCDNCRNLGLSIIEKKDYTNYAEAILSLMEKLVSERITLIQCQEIFRGSNNMKIRFSGFDHYKEHGMGKSLSKIETERLFHFLITNNFLEEYVIKNNMGYTVKYLRIKGTNTHLTGKVLLSTVRKEPAKAKNCSEIDTDNSQSRIDINTSTLSLLKSSRNTSFGVTSEENMKRKLLIPKDNKPDDSIELFSTIKSCFFEEHSHKERKPPRKRIKKNN